MDTERWLMQRMDVLRMKAVVGTREVRIPRNLRRKFLSVNVNERSRRGDTLLIEVIRSLTDPSLQVQCMNLLLREGADPNLTDRKTCRTPLMHACTLQNVTLVNLLLNNARVRLDMCDRNGNSALSLACVTSRNDLVVMISKKLVIQWDFHVFELKNVMGLTAEDIAKKQANYMLADFLSRKRLRTLKRMHQQLALLNYSAKMRGWVGVRGLHDAKKRFLRSLVPRTQSQESIPPLDSPPSPKPNRRCSSENSLTDDTLFAQPVDLARRHTST